MAKPYGDEHRYPGGAADASDSVDRTPEQRKRDYESQRERCFVATTVYGDVSHPSVVQLRRFRDEKLKKSTLGQYFIAVYNKLGPYMADFIRGKPRLKEVVKNLIEHFVKKL